MRRQLLDKGLSLKNGAMLLEGDQVWHGSAAIAELSSRMQPSDALLQVLQRMFRDRGRAAFVYPALLLARQIALALKGVSPDPDA